MQPTACQKTTIINKALHVIFQTKHYAQNPVFSIQATKLLGLGWLMVLKAYLGHNQNKPIDVRTCPDL